MPSVQNLGNTDSITLIIPPSLFLLDERVFVSLGILKVRLGAGAARSFN